MSKSVFGLDENLAAALSYPIFIAGMVVFVLERDNKFVRFHALQSILFGLVYHVFLFVLGMIPVVNWFLPPLLTSAYYLCILYLIFNAFRGKSFKLPFIGKAAYDQVNK